MPKYCAAILCIFLFACAPKEAERRWHDDGSRLSAAHTSGGETILLNLIVLRGEGGDETRLLMLLNPFNNMVGDCVLKNGRSLCKAGRPFAPLARRISGAIAGELEKNGDFLRQNPKSPGAEIIEKNWSLKITWPEK